MRLASEPGGRSKFNVIMVPVDLTHTDSLTKSIKVACDVAKIYSASLYFVSVTGTGPSSVARNPEEFAGNLQSFASEWARKSGIQIKTKSIVSNDVAAELDSSLRQAAEALDADLVIAGSHVPGFADHLVRSHGGAIATFAKVSVMVIR
ncbi:MAG: universal stress protein [Burkholderiaceae bacterium]